MRRGDTYVVKRGFSLGYLLKRKRFDHRPHILHGAARQRVLGVDGAARMGAPKRSSCWILHDRYPTDQIVVAVLACELDGFVWAIGQEMRTSMAT